MRVPILFFVSMLLFASCHKSIPVDYNTNKVVLFDKIEDIVIHSASYSTGPCEPSIAINPNIPNQIIAASVLDNVYTSNDGGRTWLKNNMESTYGVYGDPVVRYNKDGSCLYAHLSNPSGKAYSSDDFLDRIVVQKSKDGGNTWSNGTFPKSNRATDHDKHWLAIDPNSGYILMTWTEFDKYGSDKEENKSRILFSLSKDGGTTWTDAISISEYEGDCMDDDLTTEGAHPGIGIDGKYYVVWSYDSKIYMDVSGDQGKTWLKEDRVVVDQPGGWAFNIPGIGRCNGMPVMKVDHSLGIHKGRIYVSWSDQRNGGDDTDIWMVYSDDNAMTWSSIRRVNNDEAGKQQFFSWMDIDQSTGHLFHVFYDRRAHNDNHTDVYLAYSTDGGGHFENIQISSESFLPEPSVFFGDYNDISVVKGIIRPIWTAQDKAKLSVHTAIINVKN